MNTGDQGGNLPAEARARALIDQQLIQAGWKVQDKKDLNLFAGQGVAVREVVMKPGHHPSTNNAASSIFLKTTSRVSMRRTVNFQQS